MGRGWRGDGEEQLNEAVGRKESDIHRCGALGCEAMQRSGASGSGVAGDIHYSSGGDWGPTIRKPEGRITVEQQ